MVSLFRKKAFPIGLDIGSSSIKMIQLAGHGSTQEVVAAEEVEFTPDLGADKDLRHDFAVCAIKEMLSRGSFQGRETISCLPNDAVRIKSMRVDVGDMDCEESLQQQLGNRLGLDPDKDEIRHMIAGRVLHGDDIKNEVICFGVEKPAIDNHIVLIEEAGLVPVGIDTVPCALLRSIRQSLRRQEDHEKVRFHVDLGSHFTTVIAGGEEGLTFIKQIPLGGSMITTAISAGLEVDINKAIDLRRKLQCRNDSVNSSTRQAIIDAMRDVNEQLAKEIAMCFRYYAVTFRGQSPQEALLSGGEAYEQTLVNALKRRLGVAVDIAHPLRGYDISKCDLADTARSLFCEWAVAAGASIKGYNKIAVGGQAK